MEKYHCLGLLRPSNARTCCNEAVDGWKFFPPASVPDHSLVRITNATGDVQNQRKKLATERDLEYSELPPMHKDGKKLDMKEIIRVSKLVAPYAKQRAFRGHST